MTVNSLEGVLRVLEVAAKRLRVPDASGLPPGPITADECDEARAYLATLAEQPSPAETAETFIAAEIDRAPEPLRRLGEYLTRVLDDDHWKTAERMLLGVAEACNKSVAEQAKRTQQEPKP